MTQPSAVGKNANINTVIKFKVNLPSDPLYCPYLTCSVYDYIFKGLAQPLLGTFNIPIGKIMKEQQTFLADRLLSLDDMIEEVKLRLDKIRVLPPSEFQKLSDSEDEEEEGKVEEKKEIDPRPAIGKEEF